MNTLTEKLRTEQRICPTCHNIIENPFTERCPRCLTPVPVFDPGCNTCIHGTSCPVSAERTKHLGTSSEHHSTE